MLFATGTVDLVVRSVAYIMARSLVSFPGYVSSINFGVCLPEFCFHRFYFLLSFQLTLPNIIYFMWEWCERPPSFGRVQRCGISNPRLAVKLASLLREVFTHVLVSIYASIPLPYVHVIYATIHGFFQSTHPPPIVTGPGKFVQIDESIFRRREVLR